MAWTGCNCSYPNTKLCKGCPIKGAKWCPKKIYDKRRIKKETRSKG